MKRCDFKREKARCAFESLYPFLIRRFEFTDREIDFFIEHPIFIYRLYVCNCLCEIFYTHPGLFNDVDNQLFDICFALLEGNFLPF